MVNLHSFPEAALFPLLLCGNYRKIKKCGQGSKSTYSIVWQR